MALVGSSAHCLLDKEVISFPIFFSHQKFIEEHKDSMHTWMGLTDQNGPWRWVDGTNFDTGFKYVCHLQLAPLYLGLTYLWFCG